MFEQQIDAAKQIISKSNLFTQHTNRVWDSIKWNECKTQLISSSVEAGSDLTINLFPLVKQGNNYGQIIKCFGYFVYNSLDEETKNNWKYKFDLPTKSQVDEFISKLTSGSFETYLKLVESSKSPITRLVHLNIANALIANGVSINDCVKVDVLKWPSTEAYANLTRNHSLIPIISAYTTRDVLDNYHTAFYELAVSKLGSVYHTEVREKLENIIRRTIEDERR